MHQILHSTLEYTFVLDKKSICFDSHFKDKETEAQKGDVIC